MKLNPLVLFAALAGFGMSASATTVVDGSSLFGTGGETYTFTALTASTIEGTLATSTFYKSGTVQTAGFNVTSVLLDGTALSSSFDTDTKVGAIKTTSIYSDLYYVTGVDVSAGTHTLQILGKSVNAGTYSGTFSISPVPEASGVTMSLAGLAMVSAFVRRRARKV